jgi:hypothetical protein
MRVEGNGTGVINWRLRGRIGFAPIDADFESRYTLNVLTGRIEEHTCVADPLLSQSEPCRCYNGAQVVGLLLAQLRRRSSK